MKGYCEILFYLFDMALFNSYILHNKINIQKRQGYAENGLEIAKLLLKNGSLPTYNGIGRLASSDLQRGEQAQHWSHCRKHIDSTPSIQQLER